MYSVDLSRRSQKFLAKLENHIRERIEESLRKLSKKPVPSDAKFVGRHKGDKVFRHRIGNYRAL